jgi:hypothetical protein
LLVFAATAGLAFAQRKVHSVSSIRDQVSSVEAIDSVPEGGDAVPACRTNGTGPLELSAKPPGRMHHFSATIV